jgi:hypothetical protein
MYEVLVCVQLLWHDHSGLGKLGSSSMPARRAPW